jgi:hypothetical protein
MDQIKRKRQVRRHRSHSAWIANDASHFRDECRVSDVSVGGARLVIDGKTEIADCFDLYFALTSTKKRCEVVWRRGKVLGIKFVR